MNDKISCRKLNLASNSGEWKAPHIWRNLWQRKRKAEKAKAVDMTEEEQEIILNHLLDGDYTDG